MSEMIITWVVALLPLLLALLLSWHPLRCLIRMRRRQKLISSYGVARLDNLIMEDGIGGHQVLEHVLLAANGLRVLLPRQCNGALFGGDKIDRWTQMIGGKSFHFENPMHQLDELLAAVRYQLPGIPVEGRLLLSGNCSFPKGRPSRIVLLEELAGEEGRIDQAVQPVLDEAWQKLQQLPRAQSTRVDPSLYVSAKRWWFSSLLLLLGLSWLALAMPCLGGAPVLGYCSLWREVVNGLL